MNRQFGALVVVGLVCAAILLAVLLIQRAADADVDLSAASPGPRDVESPEPVNISPISATPFRRSIEGASPGEARGLVVQAIGDHVKSGVIFIASSQEQMIESGESDAAGICTLRDVSRADTVHAVDRNGAWGVANIRPFPESRRILVPLEQRQQLVGHVSYIPGGPERPVALRFRRHRLPAQLVGLPLPAQRLVAAHVADFKVEVNPIHREFRFAGLSHGWSGTIEIDDGSLVRRRQDGSGVMSRSLLVEEEDGPIELELQGMPRITGQLYRGSQSLHDVQVVATESLEHNVFGRRVVPDAEGRFRFFVAPGTHLLDVSIQSRGVEQHTRSVEGPILDDIDLGEIKLIAPEEYRIVVQDLEGVLISGAVAISTSGALGDPSTGDGVVTMPFPGSKASESVQVIARGYLPTTLEVTAGCRELLAQLRPCGEVVVQITDPEGAPIRGVYVVVESAVPFRDGISPANAAAIAAGTTPGVRLPESPEFAFRASYRANGDGRVVLGSVASNALLVNLIDEEGAVVRSARVRPAIGASTTTTLVVSKPVASPAWRVVDPDGSPISGAWVSAGTHPQATLHARSGDDGTVALWPLLCSQVTVALQMPGFCSTRLRLDPRVEHTIVLRRARPAELVVADLGGRIVPIQNATADLRGAGVVSARRDPDGKLFLPFIDLEAARINLTLSVAGREMRCTGLVSGGRVVASLDLSGHTRVVLSWTRAATAAEQVAIYFRPVSPDAGFATQSAGHAIPAGHSSGSFEVSAWAGTYIATILVIDPTSGEEKRSQSLSEFVVCPPLPVNLSVRL